MGIFFTIGFRSLIKHKTHSLILGSAIISVTILLIIITNVTSGIQDTMMKGSTTLFSGHVNITGFFKTSTSSAAPVITDLARLRKLAREIVPEATFIVDRVNGFGKIISDQSSMQIPMMGIDVEEEAPILKDLSVAAGNISDLSKKNGLIIFEAQAKKLKVAVGDRVTVSMPTYRNMYNTMDVNVVAIVRDMGYLSNFSAFLNKDDIRELYQMKEDSSGRVMIFLPNYKTVAAVESRVRSGIEKAGFRLMDKDTQQFFMKFDKVAAEGWTGQKIDITNWEDEVSIMKWIITLFNVLTGMLTMILLTIVSLGLMNMLWITIKERTGEIGTMRAIGMQRRSLVILFIIEPFILSSLSTIIGIVIGLLISAGLNAMHIIIADSALRTFLMSDTLLLSTSFSQIIITFIAITTFTTVGAIIPAWRAGKLSPVIAMSTID